MSLGNTKLVAYGIAQDESDYRIHVSFGTGKIFFFPTASALDAVQNGASYQTIRASQPGTQIITGVCKSVPPGDVRGCLEVAIPLDLTLEIPVRKSDFPQVKGKWAMTVARAMLKRGLIPIPLIGREIQDKDIQIAGKDLVITTTVSIQVKCDWWAGRYGLAIQTHECNPLKRF